MSTKKTAADTEQQQTNQTDAAQEAEKILADARAKAAEIVAAAEANAKEQVQAAVQKAVQEAVEEAKKAAQEADSAKGTQAEDKPAGPKMVTIQLFRDGERYKDDVDVAVNGINYRIKRGEPVQVPDFVAEVLERSMKQDAATADLISRKAAEYEAEVKARNL